MKKTIVLITIMVFSVISSCCEEEQTIVGSGNLYARTSTYGDDITTITGAFVLVNIPEIDFVSDRLTYSASGALYATSCEPRTINTITEESIQLSCDKPFQYDNRRVEANTDILHLDGVEIEVDYYSFIKISFDKEFVQKAQFDNSDYLFQLEAATDDGLQIQNSKSLFMNL